MKNRTDKFCKAQSAILVEKFTFVKKLGRGHGACVNARNPMENGSQQKVAHKKRQVAARCPCQALCLIIFDAYSSHRAACHAQSRVTSQRRVPCACEPLNPRRLPPSKCARVFFSMLDNYLQKGRKKNCQVALRRHRQVPCMIMFARLYMGARLSVVFCGFTFSLPEGSRWIAAILR